MYKTKRRNPIPLTTHAPAPSTADTPTAIRPETSEWQKTAENGRNFNTPATSAAPISLSASSPPSPGAAVKLRSWPMNSATSWSPPVPTKSPFLHPEDYPSSEMLVTRLPSRIGHN